MSELAAAGTEAEGGDQAAMSRARARLAAWFRREQRPLAWRRERDPWAVWLSEIVLQQTRAEQAEPYFRRLLAAYPSVEALAAAPLEELLSHWSGLGYYRRARMLHRAARDVIAGGGELPHTIAAWRRLPGVGEYTAAAVASIAFGVAEPAIDGNVERVMVRLLALEGDPRRAAARRALRAAARRLLDPRFPGQSNQALIELGATVCRPRRPRCQDCALAELCRARRLGLAERLPSPRPLRRVERRGLVAAVVRSPQGAVLLARRPEDGGLLEGTWEVPWAPEGPLAQVEAELERRYGGSWALGPELGRVRHSVTFRRLEVAVHCAELRAPVATAEGERGWFGAGGRQRLPRSSLVAKVLGLIPRARRPGRRRG